MKSILQSLSACRRLALLAGVVFFAAAAPSSMAQGAAAKLLADYEAMGYVRMDSLNHILLYESKEGKNTDSAKLLDTVANDLSGAMRQRFAQFSQASDSAIRMEARQALDYDLQDRKSVLARSRGYLLPVLATIGDYDPALKRLSMRLTLDVNGVSNNRTTQCALLPQQGSRQFKACVSVKNMDDADPIFHYLPVETPQVAEQLKLLIGQGPYRLFAQAEPSGPYQNGRTIAVDLVSGADVAGNQPANILALVLADIETAGVIAAGKAKPLSPDSKPASGKEKDLGKEKDIAKAPPVPRDETPRLGGQPDGQKPGPDGQTDHPENPPGPAGTDIVQGPPTNRSDLETDKFLSLLSFTVYATPAKLNTARRDLENMQVKFARISDDEARIDLIQQKELKKLASKIERQTRKVELLETMLELKQTIPERYGARLVDGPHQPKLNYERYRLRDGRDAIVFRGTADISDMETNFLLAVTPESLSELGATLGRGETLLEAMANRMREQSDSETAGRPEAFKAADSLITAIIRSGVKSDKLLVTGHSLGGGLAQYAGIRNRVGTVVTFNTAPLSTQLQYEIASTAASFPGVLRHYVAFVPGPVESGQVVMDPVSQRIGLSEFKALQVIGQQHMMEVCNDLDSPEYQSFFNTTQGLITYGTLGSLVDGKYKGTVRAGSAAGAVAGYKTATTDKVSSTLTGMLGAGKATKGVAAIATCVKHPFLCSAKAATGGVVSALASGYIPKIWNMYTAHRMKSIFDVLHGYAPASCNAY